jgi:hypothetical protein
VTIDYGYDESYFVIYFLSPFFGAVRNPHFSRNSKSITNTEYHLPSKTQSNTFYYYLLPVTMKYLRSRFTKRKNPENPSVTDYTDKEALEKAVGKSSFHSTSTPPTSHVSTLDAKSSTVAVIPSSPSPPATSSTCSSRRRSVDKLPIVDRNTTEVKTMKQEVERLLVLQSYLILDAEREDAFERITGIASRVFDVPIALVSFVDLGRQWFLSNRGMGDVRETPRKDSFCAHLVQGKYNILIVPDATKDVRFKDNPLVTGAPEIRFYAGVPLVSPEGHRLGSVCIISPNARPQGLTQAEQETLHDLSAMTINALVDRRSRLQNKDTENSVLLQQTCTDVMVSLGSIQHSLTTVCGDPKLQQYFGKQLLQTWVTLVQASECMGINADMCRSTLQQVGINDQSYEGFKRKGGRDNSFADLLDQIDNILDPVTDLDKLVNNLKMIMDPLPKKVPVTISVDPTVPAKIAGDDLTLFRSGMSLLSNAVSRAHADSGEIRLSIFPSSGHDELFFECRDSGSEVPSEEQEDLFTGSSRLASFAATVSSMDGEYGYQQESDNVSVFWFSVPYTMLEGSCSSVATTSVSLAAKPTLHAPDQ